MFPSLTNTGSLPSDALKVEGVVLNVRETPPHRCPLCSGCEGPRHRGIVCVASRVRRETQQSSLIGMLPERDKIR